MKYFVKYIRKQDLRNEIYISSKLVGNDNFFPDPEVIDPFPKGEDPHCVKIKVKWKGIDSDYVEYDLKKFRSEFHSNTDIRIAGTPSNKKLNNIISFTKNSDSSYDIEVIDTDDKRYKTFEKSISNNSFKILEELPKTMNSQNLNQILYGPPGTGKTYSTITKALDIIGIDYSNYNEAQELFQNELTKRIEFVTMHQSFSYEDFVQGLKPKIKNEKGIEFEYKNGVFKELCRKADEAIYGDTLTDTKKVNNRDICKIAFYLSKFNGKRQDEKLANKKLGYESDSDARVAIGEKINEKPNTIKNHRDKFDYMFKDRPGYTARNGWNPRNNNDVLDNTESWPYREVYEELNDHSFEEISSIVNEILQMKTIHNEKLENNNHVIILDEINRANISRVFGELIALIEEDKRDGKLSVTLPSGETFTVPSNLYIIGTMNTADKSIALVDIALRRRFKFIAMYPDLKALTNKLKDNNFTQIEIDERVNLLSNLNQIIRAKKSVDFEIGHSYFMQKDNLIDIMNDQILPLLNEYFMYDLYTVKNILEKQQKDREGNQIPKLGIKIDEGEFKTRGLLRITSINPEQEN